MESGSESEPASVKWDLDSDEIASVASEELASNRPNRWPGTQSTWRLLTHEERVLWRSMKQLRDQDLATHLYDAFALKRRGKDPATARDLMVQTEDGQDAIWAPPKRWTAWPLKPKHLPKERLLKEDHDEDDEFTFRREEQEMPSSELQAELGAAVLRLAKNRFNRRKAQMPQQSIEQPIDKGEGIISSSDSASETSGNAESADSEKIQIDGEMDMEGDGEDAPRRRARVEPKTYQPMVSTNDELSYKLLKPAVRHILSQLDDALRVLHNGRVSGLSYLSDSSTEDDSDSQTEQTLEKRGRGRPKSTAQLQGDSFPAKEEREREKAPSARKRGRPRKVHIPRAGETEEEMNARIARKSHRRLPPDQEPKKDPDEVKEGDEDKDEDAGFEAWVRKGNDRMAAAAAAAAAAEAAKSPEPPESNKLNRLERWGLRDWSDVVGAAAVAGFPSDVIARTTKRCADLFGQGMVIRRLDEVPASRKPGFEDVVYKPEKIQLSNSDGESEDDEDDEMVTLTQRRLASRQASLARSSHGSESETTRGRDSPQSASQSASRSQSRSQSQSRSRSSAGILPCPVPTCKRAARGFPRKTNLRRHMQLVHPGYDEQDEERGSDEEVLGAVHVDGFLKPIQSIRGWRAEDTGGRTRKRFWGERAVGSGSQSRAASSGPDPAPT